MYLRCDGTLTIDANGYAECDNWATVTTSELLGDALQAHKLSADDFTALGSMTVVILLAAFGVKMTLKTILTSSKDE